MATPEKARFFDRLAGEWDHRHDLGALADDLSAGLEELGVRPDEVVVDVGSGTGNLTLALLARLSERGRVVAVDISPEMVAAARRKVADPRVRWHLTDATRLPLAAASVDRVICCAVWPHLDDPLAVAREAERVLRPGGACHVWHLAPRARINEIHASVEEPAVRGDLLAPAGETAAVLAAGGLTPTGMVDDDTRYLVTATKPGR